MISNLNPTHIHSILCNFGSMQNPDLIFTGFNCINTELYGFLIGMDGKTGTKGSTRELGREGKRSRLRPNFKSTLDEG